MKTVLRTLLDVLEQKNSWGKNELKAVILNIIADTERESIQMNPPEQKPLPPEFERAFDNLEELF